MENSENYFCLHLIDIYIGLDKGGYQVNIIYFSTKTYVVGTH